MLESFGNVVRGDVMIEKERFIQSLPDVKLVLGNGFDLYCGLKTKYEHFFKGNKNNYDFFIDWIKKFELTVGEYIKFNVSNHRDFWEPFNNFDKISVWYFIFYVNEYYATHTDDYNWNNIEFLMKKWLTEKTQDAKSNSFNFESVYSLLCGSINRYKSTALNIVTAVIYRKYKETKFKNREEFYLFLLSELKLFENDFGKYIRNQLYEIYDESFGCFRIFRSYLFRVKNTIEKLCNPQNIVNIDSFNYTVLDEYDYSSKFHNINGDFKKPIFGIDSSNVDSTDIVHIFSKTNRRLSVDMISDSTYNREDFKNVIIFGHSLNEADYSYFFSIFDYIDIMDLSNDHKVIFAYSVYDESKLDEILFNNNEAIYKLFREYSLYKGENNNPNRLLDALTTQGKIILYKI